MSTREELGRATKRRVVDAAGQLFQERGFAAATVRDIAEISGVSVGTVMATGDKHALLVQVFDMLLEDEHFQRAGSNARSNPSDLDACVDRLIALVTPFLTLFLRRQDLSRAYAAILVTGNHNSTLFTDLAARLIEEFGAAITEHGCTPTSDAAVKASALYYAYVGVLFTWPAQVSGDLTELVASLRGTFAAICTCKE